MSTCNCRELNTPPKPGEFVVCDHCLADEIRRLDQYYDDGRKGFICPKCGAPAWEPQGSTTCADCLETKP